MSPKPALFAAGNCAAVAAGMFALFMLLVLLVFGGQQIAHVLLCDVLHDVCPSFLVQPAGVYRVVCCLHIKKRTVGSEAPIHLSNI